MADRGTARGPHPSVEDVLHTLFALSGGGNAFVTSDGERMTVQELLATIGPEEEEEEDEDDMEFQPDDGEEDQDEEEYEEDDEEEYMPRRYNTDPNWYPTADKEPKAEGLELLKSGEFGRIAVKLQSRSKRFNLAQSLLARSSKAVPVFQREDINANLVPNTNGTTVAKYDANMYTAQFSDDSSFFYTCAQDFKLHLFDMRAPPSKESLSHLRRRARETDASLSTRMAVRKVIQGHPGRWTITDANLSPDNERMIYSSISPTVYMTSTAPDGDLRQIPIPFSDPVSRTSPLFSYTDSFGIWSCRFSADGNEVVAGGTGKIFVYDLIANRRTVKISAHSDDVNSCCWADRGSGNVLVSASDDTFLKVWDRRSLGASRKPAGVLMGHTEGITYVSAKGDGRYIISNGKDQALRLWDLRNMRSSSELEAVENNHYGIKNFDYRYPTYGRPRYLAHPKDCSVMTFRGHRVLRTLIRCHFSPQETTGGQYIYSGSSDGKIHIWSLDGTIVEILDRSKTLPDTFSPSGPEPEPTNGLDPHNCVRDVSWHTQEPVIMSAAWDSYHGGTVVARHEYKGLSKMGYSLKDYNERKRQERQERQEQNSHSRTFQTTRARPLRRVPGAYILEGLSDEEF